MPFNIIRNDITKMNVDAIVNTANTDLLMGGGVCGAIFNVAGASKLQKECNILAPVKTGEAVITSGFDLPVRYIIHAVGPIYHQWSEQESKQLLYNAFSNALELAVEYECESIAFPLISSGIYGYPQKAALEVATRAIKDFLRTKELDVYLVVFDKSAVKVSEELLGEVASYIDDHYFDLKAYDDRRLRLLESERSSMRFDSPQMAPYHREFTTSQQSVKASIPFESIPFESNEKSIKDASLESEMDSLEDLFQNLDEPFSQSLLRLIDEKGMTDVEVYKGANIDRRLFSKIRTGKGYMPSKKTTLALAIALKLSTKETNDLLSKAGYTLSRSQMFDVIVEYFISNKRYDIFEINEVLFSYDQQLLGN